MDNFVRATINKAVALPNNMGYFLIIPFILMYTALFFALGYGISHLFSASAAPLFGALSAIIALLYSMIYAVALENK